MEHPPPPWTLQGPVVIVPGLVPTAQARELVRGRAQVLPVRRGFTLGGILLAHYAEGSTLDYGELIAVGALARRGRQVGFWVPQIYVDHPASQVAGQQVWALPKTLARFGNGGIPGVVSVRLRQPLLRLPLPTVSPIFGPYADEPKHSVARGVLRVGPAPVRVDVPADGPLATVGIQLARVGLVGHARMVIP
jgi:hypothetical protein